MSWERNAYQYERIRKSVAPVVGSTAGLFARDPWTPEQDLGLLCLGRRARRRHASPSGRGDADGVSAAKTPSIERRLARFLANTQINVLPVWTRLVGHFLAFWRDQRLVFVLDATALDQRATVLYLGLLVLGPWSIRGSCR